MQDREYSDDTALRRAVGRALDRGRGAARLAWKWTTATLVVCILVELAAPVLIVAATAVLGCAALPAGVRQSTIRRLSRASDWTPAAITVTVEGVGRGRRAHAAVKALDRPAFTTNIRRSSGLFPSHGAELHGYVSGRERLLLTPDGRVRRLPPR